jgi:hypothetical protein
MSSTTAQTPANVKGATMAAIKGHMPQFFTLNVSAIIKSLSDKAETRAMLARALTGAALERAQSGNTPALSGADSALDSVKGKAQKQAIDNALSIVRAIKSRAMSSATVAEYEGFANETYSQLIEALTPAPANVKAKAPAINWKDRAMAAEAAHAVLLAYAATLPGFALPVGATLAPVEVEAATM